MMGRRACEFYEGKIPGIRKIGEFSEGPRHFAGLDGGLQGNPENLSDLGSQLPVIRDPDRLNEDMK